MTYPSTRPTWRENDAEYTVEKYLPSFLHTIETGQSNTISQVNDNQHHTGEFTSLYPVCKHQQEFAMPVDNKVPEPASYDHADTVPHVENDELEQNDTGVSDDEESELGCCYEYPQ